MVDSTAPYKSLESTPFSIIGQILIDSLTGQMILKPELHSYTRIIDYHLITNNRLLVNLKSTQKNTQTLIFIDIDNSQILWSSSIDAAGNKRIKNLIHHDNGLYFTIQKRLVFINTANGDVMLNEKENIARLTLNHDNNLLLATEKGKNSIVGTFFKTAFTGGLYLGYALLRNIPLGKKIMAYDLKTTKKRWKKNLKLEERFLWSKSLDEQEFFVRHEEGGNVYSYQTGKKVWKKDFEKKIRDIEKTTEGYLVYYGSKKMLLNERGKKQWKKAKKHRTNIAFKIDEEEDFSELQYNDGTIVIRPHRIDYYQHNNKKSVWKISLNDKTRMAYDQINDTVVILKGESLYIINPDKGFTLNQRQQLNLKKPKDFSILEVRDNGYFISSPWEYVITDFSGKVIKQQYFKQPGENLRIMGNIASDIILNYAAVEGLTGSVEAIHNASLGSSSLMVEGSDAAAGYFKKAKKTLKSTDKKVGTAIELSSRP